MDDVGRTPGPWDELTAFAAGRPGVVLLGSIREEDLPLVTGLQHVEVVRPHLDEKLAESICTAFARKTAQLGLAGGSPSRPPTAC